MTAGSALVTGASRGIGAAIARALAEEGFDLTISARRVAALDAAAADLSRRGVQVQTAVADMALEDDVRRLARAHLDRFDVLDVLVVNAGMAFAAPLDHYPLRRLDKQIAVNLRSPLVLVQECLPALRQSAAANPRRGAKIVAITSMAGVAPEPQLGAYGATKAALVALCEALDTEESSGGVSATAISPGWVDTAMGEWAADRVDRSTMIEPEDVAEVVRAIVRISARSVVPHVVVARPGPHLWRA